MTLRRFLVIGADGMLGSRLFVRWQEPGLEVAGTCLLQSQRRDLYQFDLANMPDNWQPPIDRASAVICAAVTNQEQCRREPHETRKINVTQTLDLARRLARRGCFITFISSNMVFDGSKPLRSAGEPVSPKTEYGRQKADVEAGLMELGDQVAIVRLTKVIHAELPVLRGWTKSLAEGKQITPFSDYLCSPLSMEAAIETIARTAEQQVPGIWQASSIEDISYAEIAYMVARKYNFERRLIAPVTAPPGLLEHLPVHTTLDATRTTTELGVEFAPMRRVIESCLNDNA